MNRTMKSALISLAMVHAAAAGVATCNTGQVPDLTDADAAYNIDRTDWDGTEAGCTGGICLMSWQGVNPWISIIVADHRTNRIAFLGAMPWVVQKGSQHLFIRRTMTP